MCPISVRVLLRILRFLLPLAACSWGLTDNFSNWANSDEPVHLYTSSLSKNFFLQIHPNGQVDGSPSQTVHSALIIKAISAGYVRIFGLKTRFNLCMHGNGVLFGSSSFSNDCIFKHTLLENHLDVYESRKHNLLVSLGILKKPLVPQKNIPRYSQFLNVRNEIPLSQLNMPSSPQEVPWDDNGEPCDNNLGEAGIDPCYTRWE